MAQILSSDQTILLRSRVHYALAATALHFAFFQIHEKRGVSQPSWVGRVGQWGQSPASGGQCPFMRQAWSEDLGLNKMMGAVLGKEVGVRHTQVARSYELSRWEGPARMSPMSQMNIP